MLEKDRKLIQQIVDEMYKVREAKVADASTSLSFGDEQKVETRLELNKRDIGASTGRSKVRDVVIDGYEKEFKKYALEVKRVGSTLRIQTVPPDVESSFTSLSALRIAANEAEKKMNEGE